MKLTLLFITTLLFASCTIKHEYNKPSGPSYNQQNSSADKAFKEL
jgi:hypothetical protein